MRPQPMPRAVQGSFNITGAAQPRMCTSTLSAAATVDDHKALIRWLHAPLQAPHTYSPSHKPQTVFSRRHAAVVGE